MNERTDQELAGRATQHAHGLRNPNSGGENPRHETSRSEINGAGEREGRAGALKHACQIGKRRSAGDEKDATKTKEASPDRDDRLRSDTIKSDASD